MISIEKIIATAEKHFEKQSDQRRVSLFFCLEYGLNKADLPFGDLTHYWKSFLAQRQRSFEFRHKLSKMKEELENE